MDVGVVGLGKMGILHCGIVNSLPGAHVQAICEKDGHLLKAGQELLPKSVAFYSDVKKMVEQEHLDAVYVTTPINTHLPLILELVNGNPRLSIFVEKPLASSGELAQKACEAVQNLNGVYMVGFQKRFSPVFRRAREVIVEGTLGDLMFFRSSIFSSDVLRQGTTWRFTKGSGGVLLDLAPHLLDMLLWFFGEPKKLKALTRRIYSTEVDDYVHTALEYESGLEGYFDACWTLKEYRLPELMIEVYGKRGVLTVTDDFIRCTTGNNQEIQYKSSFKDPVPFLLVDPEFTKESETFLACAEQKTTPDSNFVEAAKVNRMIGRVNESALE